MKTPKVSVVIGAYNCGRFIQDTVNSVINQTFKDWELIIVDDGSTDDTYEKVKDINDERIRIIRLGKNSGRPAVPRNRGIKASTGEFIAFLDHDDIWLPEKLCKQVELMEKNKDVFLVYSRCYVQENGKGQRIISPERPKSGYVFNDLFLAYNFIGCSTAMMRNKKGFQPYLFNEDKTLMTVEDYDLWLRIAYREKISFIDEPLAIYRLHSQNTSYEILPFLEKVKLVMKKFAPLVPKRILFKKYISFYTKVSKAYAKIILRSLFTSLLNVGKRLLTKDNMR